MIAFESRRGSVTDPAFREDLRFFLSGIAESHNINLLLFERHYRGRFRSAPVAGEPWWLHTPDPAWIEAALRKMGQRARRGWFESRDDVYRGGPAEQELYDRISYDKLLEIDLSGDTYRFTYAGEFVRPIYTDNRSRAVSLTQLDSVEDFSLGHWENGKLLVEAHPRDGGFAEESYTLINGGTQLQVEMYIKPRTFEDAIEITRVFDRQAAD